MKFKQNLCYTISSLEAEKQFNAFMIAQLQFAQHPTAQVKYVDSFRYLRHVILSNGKDSDDIQREVRNLFMQTNVFVRRFVKCCLKVKLILFRLYCICLDDACLWSNYTAGCLSKQVADIML